MATPSTRNLVLLLSSGHTVRIALREADLNHMGNRGVRAVREMLKDMPAAQVIPDPEREITFAYVEDIALPIYPDPPNDLQRITVEGPGAVYGG